MFSMGSGGFRWNRRIRDVRAGWNDPMAPATGWWPGPSGMHCRSGPCGWARRAVLRGRRCAGLGTAGSTGRLEPLVQGPVVGGELPYSLFEGGVLGGDALDGLLGPLGFQVPDLAEEFADAGALLRISAWAAFSASSALRARSRQVASCPVSCARPGRLLAGGRWPLRRRPPRFWPRGCCRGRCGRRPPAGRRRRR